MEGSQPRPRRYGKGMNQIRGKTTKQTSPRPRTCSSQSPLPTTMASTHPSCSKPSGGDRPDRVSARHERAVLRNAVRYTISAKEYETLHKYIISRSKILKRNAPTVAKVEKLVEPPGRDDYHAAAVRASLRAFMATAAWLKVWGLIQARLLGQVDKGFVSSFNGAG